MNFPLCKIDVIVAGLGPDVDIGCHSTIGAGSPVTKNVSAYHFVVGNNPAKLMGSVGNEVATKPKHHLDSPGCTEDALSCGGTTNEEPIGEVRHWIKRSS